MDVLSRIEARRRVDAATAEAAVPAAELLARIADRFPDPPLDAYAVATVPGAPLAVATEFKRASPSKGELAAPGATVEAAAAAYTRGGAAFLSILTEPTWFKGTLEDLEAARGAAVAAAAAAGRPRPAMLRKDFILTPYQLLEARAFGADTALLIVSSLPTDAALRPLIDYARSLGMEPLVEVNSVDETRIALAAGALLLGVNNRNLRTFTVDMGTTARVVAFIAAERATALAAATATAASVATERPPAPVVLSLSGITDAADIAAVVAECGAAAGGGAVLRGFLIGEALMRAADPEATVARLVATAGGGGAADAAARAPTNGCGTAAPHAHRRAAKVCGVRCVADALHAARAGAAFVGVILVPGSPRCVTAAVARAIAGALRSFREKRPDGDLAALAAEQGAEAARDDGAAAALRGLARRADALVSAARRARPLLVGVFLDQTAEDVAAAADAAGVDVVQLHGSESAADFRGGAFRWPIVKVVHVSGSAGAPAVDGSAAAEAAAVAAEAAAVATRVLSWAHAAAAVLVDSRAAASAAGGTGLHFDAAVALPALGAALGAAAATDGGPAGAAGLRMPVFLAGGFTPATVGDRLRAIDALLSGCGGGGGGGGGGGDGGGAWCDAVAVDVSSGVEFDAGAAPPDRALKGFKDADKVSAFVAAVSASGSSR